MAKAGKKYQEAAKLVEAGKLYTAAEAMELVKKTATKKFDETIELHVRLGVDPKYADQDEFSLLSVLEETSGREMPQAIKDILNANILHDLECDADKMKDTVKNILEV